MFKPNDKIKTVSKRFEKQWKGKIRRQDNVTKMYLIEWDYCGGFPTDICTWVFESDIALLNKKEIICLK
jgi:hypothetical protein